VAIASGEDRPQQGTRSREGAAEACLVTMSS
jgi:hypothetical protein